MRRQNDLDFPLPGHVSQIMNQPSLGAWVKRSFNFINQEKTVFVRLNP